LFFPSLSIPSSSGLVGANTLNHAELEIAGRKSYQDESHVKDVQNQPIKHYHARGRIYPVSPILQKSAGAICTARQLLLPNLSGITQFYATNSGGIPTITVP